jgi:hypothetical protein
MFAIVAAVLFILGIAVPDGIDSHSYVFWMLLGLAALALHFAAIVPALRVTRRQ